MLEKLSPTKNPSYMHHSMRISIKNIYGFYKFELNFNEVKRLKRTKNDFFFNFFFSIFYFIIQANKRRFFAKINNDHSSRNFRALNLNNEK